MSKKFDPADHLMKVRGGAEYLEVKWRLVWLRDVHPDAAIDTDMISMNEQHAIFKATVTLPSGGSATGWGSETPGDFRDYIEKAETKALGRALAALGFGTQFTGDDLSEGERIVDAPVQRQTHDAPQVRHNAPQRQEAPRPAPTPSNGGNREQAATPRQVQFIAAIARELGMSEEELRAESSQSFSRDVGALNRRDASIFIERLQQRRANNQVSKPAGAPPDPYEPADDTAPHNDSAYEEVVMFDAAHPAEHYRQ